MSKFGTKNALLGIFDQEPYLHFFGQELKKKTVVIFEISILKFFYLQNFSKKQKCLDLGIFRLKFANNIVIVEISTLKFV